MFEIWSNLDGGTSRGVRSSTVLATCIVKIDRHGSPTDSKTSNQNAYYSWSREWFLTSLPATKRFFINSWDARTSFIIMTQSEVCDTALSARLQGVPRLLYHSMPIKESSLGIQERLLAVTLPGMCTRFSPTDRQTLLQDLFPCKDLLQDSKPEALYPSASTILPRSLLAISDEDNHHLRWTRVHLPNYQGISLRNKHEPVERTHYILEGAIKRSFVTFLSRTYTVLRRIR